MDAIKKVLSFFAGLKFFNIGIPALTDETAVRAWLKELLTFAGRLAALTTSTTIDDDAVAWLAGNVASDATWPHLYKVVTDLVHNPLSAGTAAGLEHEFLTRLPAELAKSVPSVSLAGTPPETFRDPVPVAAMKINWDAIMQIILAIANALRGK